MILVPFSNVFPEVAKTETRGFHILEKCEAPVGDYFLIEFYCPEINCDCRKVDIGVFDQKFYQLCTLTFGWEKTEYYSKHFGFECPELPGPSLAPMQHQDSSAEFFLKQFLLTCANDEKYVDRLKRHYQMIKEKSMSEKLCNHAKEKPGRNDPCFCGSQKKYKHCCMNK